MSFAFKRTILLIYCTYCLVKFDCHCHKTSAEVCHLIVRQEVPQGLHFGWLAIIIETLGPVACTKNVIYDCNFYKYNYNHNL